MARSGIQFQKGLSLPEFHWLYPPVSGNVTPLISTSGGLRT